MTNMKDLKFTPGPWKVRMMTSDDQDDGECNFFVEAANNNIQDLRYGIEIMMDDFGDHSGYPREQKLSDAILISKAPEMYYALLKAKEAMEHITHNAGFIKLVAEAKGSLLEESYINAQSVLSEINKVLES